MRRRSGLAERAAAIFTQRPRQRPMTFNDHALLVEIARALEDQQRDALVRLDRLREKAGLPQDPRVARELAIDRRIAEIFPARKGTAA